MPHCSEAFAAGMIVHFVWDGALIVAGLLFGWKVRGCRHHRHRHE